ncbi:hypothetical protein DRJ17_05790 [Candidatus Woesearchaeota archaeon]|nr:MAG: hypothetical protein DRJ17_05790 [Candidatus Woesearchaeota archaeon]
MYKVGNRYFQDFNKAVEYARARAEKIWKGHVDVEEDGKRIFRIKKWINIGGILESEEIWYK